MKKIIIIYTAFFLFLYKGTAQAQPDKKLHLTTGIGINNIQGELKNTFRSTLAFNSGFELQIAKTWYAQADLNFNSLKYDQQKKDENSAYLFQNTNSSFFMLSTNFGRDFSFGKSPLFLSSYIGSGYLSLGKPRIDIDEANKVVTQKIIRAGGIIGKAGGRIGVNTNSQVLQTVYLDGYWLTSTVKSHDERFRSISVFLGMRMAMHHGGKVIKRQMKTLKRIN